ncbi:hypothetical protein ACIQXV_27390 [Neobacillus sp. NPDC097160]|uniref:hypothetical protein n=1 Tax=Neobacillus sp. NPDC097160 TaxID=3364298 RepID=UPI00381805CC
MDAILKKILSGINPIGGIEFIFDKNSEWNESNKGSIGFIFNKNLQFYIEDTDGNVELNEIVKTPSIDLVIFGCVRDKTYQIKFEYTGIRQNQRFSHLK